MEGEADPMNDPAVKALWEAFQSLERRVLRAENKIEFLRGQVKARLKEEAVRRNLEYDGTEEPEVDVPDYD